MTCLVYAPWKAHKRAQLPLVSRKYVISETPTRLLGRAQALAAHGVPVLAQGGPPGTGQSRRTGHYVRL